jgi:sugar lactone lactonase YvrE
VASDGTATSLRGGFGNPVGMTVDSTASEIYVADAGDGALYTVPVAGGPRTARAAYSFASTAPSGLAFDSIGAIVFITSGPPAIRGSTLPRIDPLNANFGALLFGPTVGYGDLELDRAGGFVLAANDPDDSTTGDSVNNFLLSVSRDLASVSALASGVGSPLEELLGVAVDPIQQAIYFSTRRGNVYRRASDGTGTDQPLVTITGGIPVLGLELAPPGFAGFGGWLIATTGIDTDPTPDTGEMFAIDPQNPAQYVQISLTQPVSNLSDLVFSTDGELYVVDNNASTSRILQVAVAGTTGTVTVLTASAQLGLVDGIEIDEGGNRLLVASEKGSSGQLLAVDLGAGNQVTALSNFSIDRGFFPTGVVYDRLGTAVVHQGELSTSLHAAPVPAP